MQALPAAQASGPGGMPVPQTSAAARGLRLCFVLQEFARPGILRPGYAQGIDPHRQGKGADVSPSRRQTGQKATLQGRKEPRQTKGSTSSESSTFSTSATKMQETSNNMPSSLEQWGVN